MIYLDNAASTPLAPELNSNLANYFQRYGNAQSSQQTELKQIIARGQSQVASTINTKANEIHFTSGATESINTALLGGCQFYHHSGNHIITFETEHQATLAAVNELKHLGYHVTILPVAPSGQIDYQLLQKNITPSTIMVSVNHVCNETGFIQDLKPLSDLRHQHGFLLHIDASQSIGKIPVNVLQHPCDFMSLSAHKCHGPQGIGALYISSNRHLKPIIHGNQIIRSGTPPHALVALMGQAYSLAEQSLSVTEISQQFINQLTVDFERNGDGVPHILNLYFPTMTPNNLKALQQSIFCQQSSSCHQHGLSHVLLARGYNSERIRKSLRLSFSRYTTDSDIIKSTELINKILS
jgi:cysteine desulfurase